jgi:hypothetical protein
MVTVPASRMGKSKERAGSVDEEHGKEGKLRHVVRWRHVDMSTLCNGRECSTAA